MERNEHEGLDQYPIFRQPTNKKTSKEEFFKRFKPAVDSKVVTEEGQVVTSEAVLVIIKELKQFIEKGDANGYCNFLEKKSQKGSS
jgi:hypothetical protein